MRKGRTLIGRVQREATADLRDVWSDLTHDEWHRFIDLMQRFESGLRRVRSNGAERSYSVTRNEACVPPFTSLQSVSTRPSEISIMRR